MSEQLSPAPVAFRSRPGRLTRWADRYAAWVSGFAAPVRGFVSQPEPRSIGSDARGRQLIADNVMLAGVLHRLAGESPFAIAAPTDAFEAELHNFSWLDDLAAVADGSGRPVAQAWLSDWLRRFGRGRGPGWTPDIAGRRQMRWIAHALFLMNGQDPADGRRLYRAMARQTAFLSRRWRSANAGLPRFEALTGLVFAACALQGMGGHLRAATRALAHECAREIDATGGLRSRNPEELLEVFTLLTWTARLLRETGRAPDPAIDTAIMRIAPTLRSLRHADGGLARFHGGGRGAPGRLDQALADSGVRPAVTQGLAMGYARLQGGRTSVVVDAAAPQLGPGALNAHAATCAFELTSGRRPVVVNCGSGGAFGAEWRRAGRATPSHSTLAIDGYSSSRLGAKALEQGVIYQPLVNGPRAVDVHHSDSGAARTLSLGHDGYRETHGLVHLRAITLERDGRLLSGEDGLAAMTPRDRDALDRVLARLPPGGLPFSIRFHLHPDVVPSLDLGGSAVSLSLKGGEVWVFRHDASAVMTLARSVYLDRTRVTPRATKQIVLSARLTGYGQAVTWTLAKPTEAPAGHRDYAEDTEWA